MIETFKVGKVGQAHQVIHTITHPAQEHIQIMHQHYAAQC